MLLCLYAFPKRFAGLNVLFVRGQEVFFSWSEQLDGVPSYPATTGIAAAQCPAPTGLARSVSGISIEQVK